MEFNKFLDFTMFSKVFFIISICEKCSAAAVNRARKMSSTKEDFSKLLRYRKIINNESLSNDR